MNVPALPLLAQAQDLPETWPWSLPLIALAALALIALFVIAAPGRRSR
jgi:hypothetical protein